MGRIGEESKLMNRLVMESVAAGMVMLIPAHPQEAHLLIHQTSMNGSARKVFIVLSLILKLWGRSGGL